MNDPVYITWAITIVLYIVLCCKVEAIGAKKGKQGYFWWCLCYTPLVGIFLAIAEPDRNSKEK